MTEFREEINQALGNIRQDLKTTTTRMEEAQQRVAEIEECSLALEDVLLQMSQAQESMQAKMSDLELQSRGTTSIFTVSLKVRKKTIRWNL